MKNHLCCRIFYTLAILLTILLAPNQGFSDDTTLEQQSIINQSTIVAPNGHKTILNRVSPLAQQPSRSTQAAQSQPELPEEPESQNKPFKVLIFSSTVYEGEAPITELKWGNGYHAFANIDFLDFSGIGQFETQTTIYSLIFTVGGHSAEARGAHEVPLPSVNDFSGSHPSYLLISAPENDVNQAAELTALADLLAFYEANKNALQQQRALREAEGALKQQELIQQQNAPKPDTIINYWPIKSVRHATQEEEGGQP